MRRTIFLVFLIKCAVLLAVLGGGITGRGEAVFRPPVGERLIYRITFAGITLGEEVLTVKSAGGREGRRYLVIEAVITSSPRLKLLDYQEQRILWWDEEDGIPLREEAFIRQGRSLFHEVISFLPEKGVAVRTREREGEKTTGEVPFLPRTQTGLSLLYYLRRFPWEGGEDRVGLLGEGGTEWASYRVKEGGPLQVPYGRFSATYYVYHPRYELWFDKGPARFLLAIHSRFGFGQAQAKLVGVEGWP